MQIRLMEVSDVSDACALVNRVFDRFVGAGLSKEGIATFQSHANPEALAIRLEGDVFGLVALEKGEVVGVLEMHACIKLSLLFVSKDYHGKGVGRRLFDAALVHCKELGRAPETVTVNSSVFAVPMYRSLGFSKSGSVVVLHGIEHVPMVWNATVK